MRPLSTLCSRVPLIWATLSCPSRTLTANSLCQPAVACSFIRFTDDVGCGLMATLPAIRIHAAVLQHRQRAAGPAALPAVGEQDLHVMAHRAIEQEIVSFRLSFSA